MSSSSVKEVIEEIPEEMGEEIVVGNNDDGTICSKVVTSSHDEATSTEHKIPTNVEIGDSKKEGIPEEEDEKEKSDEPEEEEEERDFDKNPTILYALVQKKIWKEAAERAKTRPDEASIFVARKEKDGRIRWRLLPLHAAIVFKAPEEVIESLLDAYPKGADTKDDQGMLPLHLAFRNSAPASVVNMLLLAHPHSVDVPDRKGRLPRKLAEAASSPNREVYLEALEKGPSHYAMAAVATARAKTVAEQSAIHDTKLDQVRQIHAVAMEELKLQEEQKREEFVEKIAELEAELTKTNETSQVLVDHVNSLEAQLAARTDTERFLATKIANLDEKLRQTEALKLEAENNFSTYSTSLLAERDALSSKVEELQSELDSTKEKLNETLASLASNESTWTQTEKQLRTKLSKTEVEWANYKANAAILEAQLKKRMENEHSMAAQVSSLASRLAEQASESSQSAKKYDDFVKHLEEEHTTLKETVADLTQRLQTAAETMEFMHKQQMTIVDEAINHEQMISKALEAHAKIVKDAFQQEKELEKAREERETIRKILEQQEEAHKSNTETRTEVLEIITNQGKTIAGTHDVRENMLTAVQEMSSKMNDTLHLVLRGIDLGTSKVSLEKAPVSSSPAVNETPTTDAAVEQEDKTEAVDVTEVKEKEVAPEEVVEEETAPTTAVSVVDVVDVKIDAELGPEEVKVVPAKKLEDVIRQIGAASAEEPHAEETRTDEDVEFMRSSGDRIIESREM
jgi:hypothetical protein